MNKTGHDPVLWLQEYFDCLYVNTEQIQHQHTAWHRAGILYNKHKPLLQAMNFPVAQVFTTTPNSYSLCCLGNTLPALWWSRQPLTLETQIEMSAALQLSSM